MEGMAEKVAKTGMAPSGPYTERASWGAQEGTVVPGECGPTRGPEEEL